jgi:Domain of unknown function (DUF4405)
MEVFLMSIASVMERLPAAVFPLRPWATPVTIGAFLLMSATGVMMFFGWDRGLTSEAHEWFSWIFLAGVGAHIAANFRPFVNHLKSRWGKASIAVFSVILVASFFAGIGAGGQLLRAVERALVEAPLSTLASLTHTSPDALERKLSAHGISANSKQSVRELAGENQLREMRLLEVVFMNE